MTTFRDDFPLVLDISEYQQVIDWQKLKADNIKFVWVRSSYGAISSDGSNYGGGIDKLAANHIQHAYDAGVPVGLYHAIDPGYYFYKLQSLGKLQQIDQYLPLAKDEQMQTLIKGMQFKAHCAIAVDFELYKDWNGTTMPDGWLLEVIFQFLIRLRKVYPDTPIYFYSGSWFVWNYVKILETTGKIAKLAKLWTAYYPYGAGVVNLADADDLKPLYPPNDLTISFPDGKRVTQNPPFLGFDGWSFWQFTGDKFTLPYITDTLGRPSALDFNFYNGTVEKMYAELGITSDPVTPPDPDDPPVDPNEPPVTVDLTAVIARLDAIAADVKAIKKVTDGIEAL